MDWQKKFNDKVQQTGIIEYLQMFKISYKVINLFLDAIENW